jgi:CheY-like chemotaxis protein
MYLLDNPTTLVPLKTNLALKGKKILVVDDDPISLLIFTEMFKNEFDIYYATNSNVALDLASKIQFDGFIIDLHLGDDEPNGIELLNYIKENELKDNAAFIAVSSSSHPEYNKRLTTAGFTHFCQKPLKKQEIMRAIS